MDIAKVFQSGNSQAIRIPKEFKLKAKKMKIRKVGDSLIISEIPESWDDVFAKMAGIGDDFMPEHEQLPIQERDEF